MSVEAPSSHRAEEHRPPASNAVTVRTPVPRDVWEELFAADPGALAEHGPRWVEAICATGPWRDASRLYELGDGRRFVLPLVRKVGAAGTGGWYASPPAAWAASSDRTRTARRSTPWCATCSASARCASRSARTR
jgi:hypothetical protein